MPIIPQAYLVIDLGLNNTRRTQNLLLNNSVHLNRSSFCRTARKTLLCGKFFSESVAKALHSNGERSEWGQKNRLCGYGRR